MPRLRSLALAKTDVRREGLRALLRSPNAVGLAHLSLRGGRLDGQAMAEFASAHRGLRLESLDLGENVLKELGVEYLAASPCLRELKSLRLDRCEVPLTAARHLAKAAFADGLRVLDLGHNYLGPVGLTALLERAPAALHTLGLRDNNLFDRGAALLAGSPASAGLLEVDLSQNGLGAPETLAALGESEHLRGLLVLRLADNPTDEEGAAALAASPLGKRLTVLEFVDAPAPEEPPWPEEEPPPPEEPLAPLGEGDIPF
jgi:Ran GTPase-activating protein (RanGAP) involved in mRNA processing and transport